MTSFAITHASGIWKSSCPLEHALLPESWPLRPTTAIFPVMALSQPQRLLSKKHRRHEEIGESISHSAPTTDSRSDDQLLSFSPLIIFGPRHEPPLHSHSRSTSKLTDVDTLAISQSRSTPEHVGLDDDLDHLLPAFCDLPAPLQHVSLGRQPEPIFPAHNGEGAFQRSLCETGLIEETLPPTERSVEHEHSHALHRPTSFTPAPSSLSEPAQSRPTFSMLDLTRWERTDKWRRDQELQADPLSDRFEAKGSRERYSKESAAIGRVEEQNAPKEDECAEDIESPDASESLHRLDEESLNYAFEFVVHDVFKLSQATLEIIFGERFANGNLIPQESSVTRSKVGKALGHSEWERNLIWKTGAQLQLPKERHFRNKRLREQYPNEYAGMALGRSGHGHFASSQPSQDKLDRNTKSTDRVRASPEDRMTKTGGLLDYNQSSSRKLARNSMAAPQSHDLQRSRHQSRNTTITSLLFLLACKLWGFQRRMSPQTAPAPSSAQRAAATARRSAERAAMIRRCHPLTLHVGNTPSEENWSYHSGSALDAGSVSGKSLKRTRTSSATSSVKRVRVSCASSFGGHLWNFGGSERSGIDHGTGTWIEV